VNQGVPMLIGEKGGQRQNKGGGKRQHHRFAGGDGEGNGKSKKEGGRNIKGFGGVGGMPDLDRIAKAQP